jgi:hypothetical protein
MVEKAESVAALFTIQPSLAGLFLFHPVSRHLFRCVPGYFHSRLRRS